MSYVAPLEKFSWCFRSAIFRINDIAVYKNGTGCKFDEEALKEVMAEHDIAVNIDLGLGTESATVWTCDLSYEYVKINGEYHT